MDKNEQIARKLFRQAVAAIMIPAIKSIVENGDISKGVSDLHQRIHNLVDEESKEIMNLLGDFAHKGVPMGEIVAKMAGVPLEEVEGIARKAGYDPEKKIPLSGSEGLENEIVGGFTP